MHGNIVLSLLFIGALGSEFDTDELSAVPVVAGLTEATTFVGGVLGEAGGVRPHSLLPMKVGNLKSVCVLSNEGLMKGIPAW